MINQLATYYALGQPKIFGILIFKLQPGVAQDMTVFGVPPGRIDHVCIALKTTTL